MPSCSDGTRYSPTKNNHDTGSLRHRTTTAAIAVVVVRWRKLPVSWLFFVGLYLVPSLQLGMVGVGRYANECFPPFVAAGQVLERWRTRWLVLAYAVSA